VVPERPPVRNSREAQHLLDATVAVRAKHKNLTWYVWLGGSYLKHHIMVELTLRPMIEHLISTILLPDNLKQAGQLRAWGEEG
jgi:hypothetical protein